MAYRGEVIYQMSHRCFPAEDLVVEADGDGGATLIVVEGNFPIDYLIKFRQRFDSEDGACDAADQMHR